MISTAARLDALESNRVDMGDGHKPPSRPCCKVEHAIGEQQRKGPRGTCGTLKGSKRAALSGGSVAGGGFLLGGGGARQP